MPTPAKLRVLITGSTGMVGEGVLLECLDNPNVESVLLLNRRSANYTHPKLREILRPDFFHLDSPPDSPLNDLQRELALCTTCFFCSGVSSVGISQQEYRHLTYDLTLSVANQLAAANPAMTFCYVTGAGTDSSEHGKSAWARVKGATENALLRLFPSAYMVRPGFMLPTPGQRYIKSFYRWIAWLYPLGRTVYPAGFCTLQQVARAMINVSLHGYPKQILEVPDLVKLSRS